MNKKLPAWIVLTLISLVAALALGATYSGTQDRIKAQEAEKAVAVRQELLPAAAAFEQIAPEGETEVYRGVDADGKAVGFVSVGTVTGFGGPVEITVGMDGEGTLTGVRVGGANFSETAGLGAKSKEPAFYEQFAGKSYPVDLSKNGGEIDAITAATITSSAVVRGVNETAKYIAQAADIKLAEPVVAIEELGGNQYKTTAQGVSGPFPVVITVDDGGAVTAVEVQNTEAANDIGFLSKVQGNEAYLNQFLGQTAVDAKGLDTVSGATVSSSSVNEAVSKMLLYVNDRAAYDALSAAEADVPDVSIPEGAETFTASGKGLTGAFDVTISVDENAQITGIEVGESDSDQDAAFLGQVRNNARFLAQFVGQAAPFDAAAIDLVTGATISSKGVVSAVNEAWNKSQGIEEPAAAPVATAAPASEGGNTLTAEGLTGTFPVTVALNADGTVASVTLGETDSDMDKTFLALVNTPEFLDQFAGKALPVTDIDTVTGATKSSGAVIEAVNSLAPAGAAPEAPAGEAVEVTAQGIVDTFPVTVTIDGGKVTAVTVGESDSATDAGFVRIVRENQAFLKQFQGAEGKIGQIDIATGATVSSLAVRDAVNAALAGAAAPAEKTEASAASGSLRDGVYENASMGMSAPVTVTVTVQNGLIAGVQVADSAHEADKPYVAKVQDEAFLQQFAGRDAKLAESEIDLVSGATVSSRAVLRAVNLVIDSAAPEAPAETTEAPAGTTEAPAASGSLRDALYENASMGMNAPVTVTVTVQNGLVADVKVADSAHEADKPYVAKVQDEAFLQQFAGRETKLAESEIDLVSGATVSSRAVLRAVNLVIDSAAQ